MRRLLEKIRELIGTGMPDEAIRQADRLLADNEGLHEDDKSRLLYLKGLAHMKYSDWKKALDCFMQSQELDAEGPAVEARQMLTDIMNFYNKDMFNQ